MVNGKGKLFSKMANLLDVDSLVSVAQQFGSRCQLGVNPTTSLSTILIPCSPPYNHIYKIGAGLVSNERGLDLDDYVLIESLAAGIFSDLPQVYPTSSLTKQQQPSPFKARNVPEIKK